MNTLYIDAFFDIKASEHTINAINGLNGLNGFLFKHFYKKLSNRHMRRYTNICTSKRKIGYICTFILKNTDILTQQTLGQCHT